MKIRSFFDKLKAVYYAPLGKYNYDTYWKRRGKHYINEFKNMAPKTKEDFDYQEKRILNLFKSLKFNSLLEIGCGFGRVLKLIKELDPKKDLVGIDISKDQIKNAKKYLSAYPDIKLIVGDIKKLELSRDYDVILTSEVLMHLKDIGSIIEKIKKRAKKYIVHLEYFGAQGDEASRHVFDHDLTKFYFGYKITKIELRSQMLYLIEIDK